MKSWISIKSVKIGLLAVVLISGLFLLFNGTLTGKQQTHKEATPAGGVVAIDSVTVYYFHASQRCVTCTAVEEVTREALKTYFGESVPFVSIDGQKDRQNPLLKKFQISGQTLLLVKGDKVANLTADAFLLARTAPQKLKGKIKSTIEALAK